MHLHNDRKKAPVGASRTPSGVFGVYNTGSYLVLQPINDQPHDVIGKFAANHAGDDRLYERDCLLHGIHLPSGNSHLKVATRIIAPSLVERNFIFVGASDGWVLTSVGGVW